MRKRKERKKSGPPASSFYTDKRLVSRLCEFTDYMALVGRRKLLRLGRHTVNNFQLDIDVELTRGNRATAATNASLADGG